LPDIGKLNFRKIHSSRLLHEQHNNPRCILVRRRTIVCRTFPVNPFCLCSDHRTFLPGIQYLSGHKEKQKMNEFSTEEINQLHDSFPPFHYSHLSVILPTPRNEFRRHGGGSLLLVLLAQLCVTSGCLPRVSEIRFVPLAKA